MRSRLKTLLWFKLRLAAHSLRSVAGITETVITTLMILMGAILAILLAGTAVLVMLNVLLSPSPPDMILHAYTLAFGFLALFALVAPFVFGGAKAELDPARLLSFPMTKRELYGITLTTGALSGANLVWYPAIAALWITGVVEGWINPLTGLAATLLATLCFVGWQQLIVGLFRSLLRNRRLRELLAAGGMILLMLLGVLPNVLEKGKHAAAGGGTSHAQLHLAWLRPVFAAMPNRLAARAALRFDAGAAVALLALALWTAFAIWLGWRIFVWALERPDVHSSGRAAPSAGRRGLVAGPVSWLPPDAGALAAKQARYVLRSTAGKISLVTAPVFGIFAGVLAGKATHAFLGIPMPDLVFLGLCLFAAGFLNNMVFNIFVWDHGGVALYFTTPTPPRRVLLGLNTGLAAIAGLLLAETLITWSLLRGVPGLLVLTSGILIFANELIPLTIAGNVISILSPVPRDIGSPAARASGASGFVWMGVMTVEIVISGVPLLLWNTGAKPLIPVLLGVILVLELGAYRLLLPTLGQLLERRKERLLEALAGAPGS
ncbi:MAG: hypothetical protein GXP48_04450 [Acidobacteria bacterium]|nr:hypothetical protein [Acidobacteriota bacterium]